MHGALAAKTSGFPATSVELSAVKGGDVRRSFPRTHVTEVSVQEPIPKTYVTLHAEAQLT